jgi:hypothetical protein
MVKMKMFGFMPTPNPKLPAGTKVANQTGGSGGGGGGGGSGRMFNLKNLGSIMKIKSTGCKSCGG